MSGQSRETILNTIRKALSENAVPMPFPESEKVHDFFAKTDISLEEKFAEEFTKLGGKFVYCSDEADMIQQLEALADTMKWNTIHTRDQFLLNLFKENNIEFIQPAGDMHNLEVGLSLCECLIARTGSAIMSSGQDYGRSLPVYSPIHITIAFTNQLVWDISNAVSLLKEKYNNQLPSMMSLTTGPSRTADIEKTLVVGVHGPKEVYIFLIDKHWKK
jgi:L-lactate dehydrogenase complex protein LldG